MSHNFENFINVKKHTDEISRLVRKTHHDCLRKSYSSREYLEELSSIFLDEIKKITNEIYENITLKKDRSNQKLTAKNLIQYTTD